jgi:hypothetical protein
MTAGTRLDRSGGLVGLLTALKKNVGTAIRESRAFRAYFAPATLHWAKESICFVLCRPSVPSAPSPPDDQEDAESSSHALREAADPEMRHKMNRTTLFAALSLAIAIGIAPASNGASIVYNVVDYPALQNGYTVSGTITTNGSIGTHLPAMDITAWNITVSKMGVTQFTVTSANSINESTIV